MMLHICYLHSFLEANEKANITKANINIESETIKSYLIWDSVYISDKEGSKLKIPLVSLKTGGRF